MNESPSSRMRCVPSTRPAGPTRKPSWSVNNRTVRSPVLIVVLRLGRLTQPTESAGCQTSGRFRTSCWGATQRTSHSPKPTPASSAAAAMRTFSSQPRHDVRGPAAAARPGTPREGKSGMTPVAAAQEERFTRKKGDAAFPSNAVAYCLNTAGIGTADLAYVGFYDKPLLKFERILETYLGVAPKGFASFRMAGPLWMKEKLFIDSEIRRQLGGFTGEMRYAEHHESYAAIAFFPAPSEEAAILTVDGVGKWSTASMGVGRGHDIELLKELYWPDSLGLLYSAFTYYTGFKVNSGEYKVMGLSPYGEPKYVDTIYRELIELREDGSFHLNQKYFNYLTGLTMTNGAFDELFGGPPRVPESKLTQREMDLARSVQVVCEDAMLRMARALHRETGLESLCLAGGVALNCVANGRLRRQGPFKRLGSQPAGGEAVGALGDAQ